MKRKRTRAIQNPRGGIMEGINQCTALLQAIIRGSWRRHWAQRLETLSVHPQRMLDKNMSATSSSRCQSAHLKSFFLAWWGAELLPLSLWDHSCWEAKQDPYRAGSCHAPLISASWLKCMEVAPYAASGAHPGLLPCPLGCPQG